MPNSHEDPLAGLFNAWSTSARDMMNGYARFFVPERLTQPILPGWSVGNTYFVSEDNSRDPAMERRILAQNSYGRQLGRIMDALVFLVGAQPPEVRDNNAALTSFLQLAGEINQIKKTARAHRYDELKAAIELLRTECPEDFARLMRAVDRS